MINTCIICGKEFQAKKSTKKYCSQQCANTARRIRYKEQQQNKDKKQPTLMPQKKCLICGQTFRPKTPAANLRQCCYNCMPQGQQLKRGDFLAKIKMQRGGKCQRCGYNTCLKALEFHHLDPTKKDFTISNDKFKLNEAVEEIKKCIIICANCHRELHDDLWNIQELNLEERDS